MKLPRQIAVYFLLAITALPLFAFIFFVSQLQYLRWEMEEKMEKEQLTTLSLKKEDFKWYKNGKEIIVHGHLFDVEEIKKLPDGNLLVTGLFDYQEQELHKKMEGWMHNQDSGQKGEQVFIKWLNHLYDDNVVAIIFSRFTSPLKTSYSFYTNFSKNLSQKVLTPPPQNIYS